MIAEFDPGDSPTIEIPDGFTILCDMDGTLIDTDHANYLSYRRAIKEVTQETYDIELTEERLTRESLMRRLPSLTTAQLALIASLKTQYFQDYVSETGLNTAMARLITAYRIKNSMVLVTCCREKRAVSLLKHHKLLECFTRLICREDLPQDGSLNKYENAISLMGVRQEAVVVFENEDIGVEHALLAGVPKSNIYKIIPAKNK